MNKKIKLLCLGVVPLLLFVAVWAAKRNVPRPLPDLKGGLLAWSDDGTRLACGSLDGKTRVWDFAAGKVIREVEHGGSFCEGVGISPDGKLLATSSQGASWPDERLPVDVWNVDTGKKIASLDPSGLGARGIVFSPDGQQLCVAKAGRVSLYDVQNGFRLLRTLPFSRDKADYSLGFNGKIVLASGSGGCQCFDLTTNTMQPVPASGFGSLYAAALSDDGRTAAVGGQFGSAVVWEVKTGKIICQLASPTGGDFYGLALSGDGTTLWSSGASGVLQWKVAPTTKTPDAMLSQKAGSSEGTWIVSPRRSSGLAFSSWDNVTVRPNG